MSVVLPSIVIISCCDSSSVDLATAIVEDDGQKSSVPAADHGVDSCRTRRQKYLWNIDTKYYVSSVELCTVEQGDVCWMKAMTETLNAMEAIIIQFDSENRSSFQQTKDLVKVVSDFHAEVRLLVCSSFDEDSAVRKSETQHWCTENGFEVVELDPKETNDNQDGFDDVTGVKRIIQALQAHTWSNLVLKEKSLIKAPAFSNVHDSVSEETLSIGDPIMQLLMAAKHVTDKANTQDSSFPFDSELVDSLEDHDNEEQSFEELFEKFQSMKDKVKGVPLSERKGYAEKVTIAFWKAIGGDDEDIDGLDENQTE